MFEEHGLHSIFSDVHTLLVLLFSLVHVCLLRLVFVVPLLIFAHFLLLFEPVVYFTAAIIRLNFFIAQLIYIVAFSFFFGDSGFQCEYLTST